MSEWEEMLIGASSQMGAIAEVDGRWNTWCKWFEESFIVLTLVVKIPVVNVSFFLTFYGLKRCQIAPTLFHIVLQFKNGCFYWVMVFAVKAALTLCIIPGNGTDCTMRFSELTAEAPPRVCGVADSMKVSPSKPKQWEAMHVLWELLWVQFIKNSWYLIISALHPGLFGAIQAPENVLSEISTSHWNESTVWQIQLHQLDFSSQEEVAAAGFSTAVNSVAFLDVLCALQQTVIDWWL